MMERTGRTFRLVVAAAGLGLVLASCSTKSDSGDGGSGGGDSGGSNVKTDKGVSGSEITLGQLTDETGAFAVLGKVVSQGQQVFFDELNGKGGVCGKYKVKLVKKDHGYDVQKAVSLYAGVKDEVLGLVQSLGSPMTTALSPQFEQDKVQAAGVTWAANLLDNPYIQITGTTYDIEMIGGVDWLIKEKGLKKGDVVGHIYNEGEYGANGLAGNEYMAKKYGYTIVKQQIKATDTDMSAQVATLKAKGAKFIMMTSGPKQTASAVGVAAALKYPVTFLGSNPTYVPDLLKTAAGPALAQSFYVAASSAPFSSDEPEVKRVADAWKAKFSSQTPNAGVIYGYGVAEVFTQVLEKACKDGDLTREGVQKAFRSLTSVDTKGLIAPLDYSKAGESPSRESLVAKADLKAEGGLTVVRPLTEPADAKDFKRA